MVGEFKDDRIQNHQHNINATSSQSGSTYILGTNAKGGGGLWTGDIATNSSLGTRIGSTTRVKSKGVKYIIKVF